MGNLTGLLNKIEPAIEKEPTPKEIAQIFADHDMNVVGPPLKLD